MNENDAIQRLSNWFKDNNYIVLQDKKNNNENPLFHVKGNGDKPSRKKPDLIIQKNGFINAIEVKIGNDSTPLRTNSDLITYFCNYNEKRTTYFSEEGNELQIDNFLIASYYSPDGYLKEGEVLKNCGEKHYTNYIERKGNPLNEYSESFQIIRGSIWDVIKFNGCYGKYKQLTTGIGAVLSTKLDNEPIGKPGFLVMKNHLRHNGSPRTWWHQWITP